MPNGKPPIDLPKPLGQSMRGQSISPKSGVKNTPGIFGSKRSLEKRSFEYKLGERGDFFGKYKMGRDQRKKFAEKINKLIPGKTTLNPEDIKIVDKKLAKEESLAKRTSTSREYEIKRQRAALKDFFGIK